VPIHNNDVAKIFNKVADLLDIEGANQFRIRAYRSAARTIGGLPQSVSDMVQRDEDLSTLPGIGKDLAAKIKEIVKTGTLGQLAELEGRTPKELGGFMKMAGLGPKRVKVLHETLGVTTSAELRDAAEKGEIRKIPGFGAKMERTILEELEEFTAEQKERMKLAVAEHIADPLVDYLREEKGVKEITIAGSYRRRKETVGDLDILVTCTKGTEIMDRFVNYEDVVKTISHGKTRSSVTLRSGLQVDLRVLPQVSYGAALHYFTGSKDHNIAIRKMGVKKGLKINEYGVFKGEKDRRVAGRTEEEVYKQVGLPYIEPELRENRGEIDAAQKKQLPDLISVDDVRGDLHMHTKETDGRYTMEEMVDAARELGYEYVAVTDHSKRVTMARGLDEKRLALQMKAIDRLNGKLKDIQVLKGIEVDILEDGSLDLTDDILEELDVVVCALHYHTKLSNKNQTERVIRAMDNPHFQIWAHPTGRLINERGPYDMDLERLMKAAKERGCVLELNAHPDRLDLNDRHCKMAKDMGVKVVISTDSHNTGDLRFMRYGIYQARRGWLEPDDVVNTRSLKDLRKLLRRR